MIKPVSTTQKAKKPNRQYTPEFRREVLKLAERIGVAAIARELSLLYGSTTYYFAIFVFTWNIFY